ncbi:hypothetical protein BSL78_04244 [Apostichopus japonicus]|uniref:LINE-1 type transposase domain-containing protein 1 n=1 Tax=Stichopus japonicus TaxID=307972 RepID=A0A2G8KPR5_STIJA|nr:hypothetical protein BSL78_13172 [Apostichopus japonicus]PIK58842.1 hypothetical protein BSL78_04244 [Apostichopus japonicus]
MSKTRGRPVGSLGKKKKQAIESRSQPLISQAMSAIGEEHEDELHESLSDSEVTDIQEEANLDLTQRLENAVEKAIHGMSSELLKLKKNFERELKLHSEEINKLKSENSKLNRLCADLGNRVTSLESSLDLHSSLLNKNERFLRKNNLRIVGYKTQPSEDCLEITKEVLKKVGIQEAKLERAHRDGKAVQGRSRHILVKLSFFQDKLFAMKYAREKLKGSDYFITDDLTLTDLKEKRRWAKEVSDLYKSGTKLRFQRGMWRKENGQAYSFSAS